MMPSIFTIGAMNQQINYTLDQLLQAEDIEPSPIPVELQKEMVRTHRFKVGNGPKENWKACRIGYNETSIPQRGTNMEWVVN